MYSPETVRQHTLGAAFIALFRRDLTLAFRHRAEMANPLLFFVLVTSLFPLGIGADPKLLQAVGPGVIWVAALLAALLSLEGIFRSDFEDGTLEQFLLSSHPVSVLVLAKVLAHWLITGLPLLVISPLLGVLLGLPVDAIVILLITLALGTPVLSLIGAVGVAITVAVGQLDKMLGYEVAEVELDFIPDILVIISDLGKTGVEGLFTPVLAMRRGWCEPSCIRCGQVCPTQALRVVTPEAKQAIGGPAEVTIGTAFFDRGRCLPWAMETPCVVCEEVCPVSPKAIGTYDEIADRLRRESDRVAKLANFQAEQRSGAQEIDDLSAQLEQAGTRREGLQGDLTVEHQIVSAVDYTHPAAAEQLEQLRSLGYVQ